MCISAETKSGRVLSVVICTFSHPNLPLHVVKQTFNLVDIFGSVVVEKEQLGNPANLIFDLRSQFVPDLVLMRIYMPVDRLFILAGCKHTEIYLCDRKIISDTNLGDRNKGSGGLIIFLKYLSDILLDNGGQFFCSETHGTDDF